ncbi:MAG: hypothetical protein ACK4UN_00525 [Limisphaerales bacterium]
MQNPLGHVGINQAAKLTGKNKAVIHRDADSGKLHHSKNEKGHRIFQIADLISCYGELKPVTSDETSSNHQKSPTEEPIVTSDLSAALEAKEEVIATLKAQIEDLKAEREDIKGERDRWHKAFEEVKMLPAPATSQPKRFLWIFGRKA